MLVSPVAILDNADSKSCLLHQGFEWLACLRVSCYTKCDARVTRAKRGWWLASIGRRTWLSGNLQQANLQIARGVSNLDCRPLAPAGDREISDLSTEIGSLQEFLVTWWRQVSPNPHATAASAGDSALQVATWVLPVVVHLWTSLPS